MNIYKFLFFFKLWLSATPFKFNMGDTIFNKQNIGAILKL